MHCNIDQQDTNRKHRLAAVPPKSNQVF
jgi:hypothetical protein